MVQIQNDLTAIQEIITDQALADVFNSIRNMNIKADIFNNLSKQLVLKQYFIEVMKQQLILNFKPESQIEKSVLLDIFIYEDEIPNAHLIFNNKAKQVSSPRQSVKQAKDQD